MKTKNKDKTPKFIALAVICLLVGAGIGLVSYHYLSDLAIFQGMKLPEENPAKLIYPNDVINTIFDDSEKINNTAGFLIKCYKPLTENQIQVLRDSGVRLLQTSEIATIYHGLLEENKIEEVESLDFVEYIYPYKTRTRTKIEPTVNDTGWIHEGVNAVVNANNKFALDLYSKYKSEEGNIFFSPYSISTALAMTYEGAKGQTAEEMQSVFYFPEDDAVRRTGYANLFNEINKEDKKYKLHTANALWPRIDFQLLEEYQNTIDTYYGGKVTCLDYAGEAEKSRQTINGWVEDKTEDKIKDLIPSGILDGSTVLVLTNAIYFKGTWITQFDEKDTREEDFTTSSGNTVKVPMMKLTGEDARFNYAETEDLKILELPYEGEELSMLILLPKEGDLDTIEESITTEKISEYRNSLQEIQIDIYIPKFKFETKYFMADTLAEMGMPTAFGGGADFSGINGQGGIWIDKVIHQAFVEVNEEGTEAAAATAIIMVESVRISKVFRADHPFIFIIQQKDSGNILFMGRVSDPTK